MSPTVPVTVELLIDGVWEDITEDVRTQSGIGIRVGVQAESGLADANQATFTVDNSDGKFSTRNPEGPWYGYLKRNTQVRIAYGADVRFYGEISEFPTRWNLAGSDVYVPLVASGLLRRLVRAQSLRSAFTTTLIGIADAATNGHILGYWPMEDQPGSESFASPLAGVDPMLVTAGVPVLAAVDPGPGSDPIPTWQNATAEAVPAGGGTGTEFTVGFYLTVPETGLDDGQILLEFTTAGTAELWRISSAGGPLIRTSIYVAGVGTHRVTNLLVNGFSRYIKIQANQNGGNVDWDISASGVGTDAATLAGATVTSPTGVTVGASANIATDVGIGHVVLGDTDDVLFLSAFDQGISGYAGETVAARMVRLGQNIGFFPVTVVSGDEGPGVMGVQPGGTLLEVMRAAEAADAGGILHDSISELGLRYVTRAARYSDQDGARPSLELDYAAKQISAPLEPTDDDALLRNDVTVTRSGGSSARYEQSTGPLSVDDPPDGVGRYQADLTLNLSSDAVLPDYASWIAHVGTTDQERYPQVGVDLVKFPALAADASALQPGDRVRLVNLPDWLPPGDARLQVLGWVETIFSHRREITFNCAPASAYDVGVYDDEGADSLAEEPGSRYSPDFTELFENLDTTETGVNVNTPVGAVWTHADGDFDIDIGGERMTVTGISGTGAAQTFTVTRSVNGVVKEHFTGAEVTLWQPARYAL